MKWFFLILVCALTMFSPRADVRAQGKKPLKIVLCEFQNMGTFVLREFGDTGKDVVGLHLSHDVASYFQKDGYGVVYPEEVYANFILKKGIGPSSFTLPETRRMMAGAFSADYVVTGEITDSKKKKPFFGFGVYEGFLLLHVTLSSADGSVLFETTLQAQGRDKQLLHKAKTNEKIVFNKTLATGAQLLFETLDEFISPPPKTVAPPLPVVQGTQTEAFESYQKGVEAMKAGNYEEAISHFQKFLAVDTVGIFTKDAQQYIEEAKKKLGKTDILEKPPAEKDENKLAPVSVVNGESMTFTGGTVDFKEGIIVAEGKGLAPKDNSKLTAKSLAKRAAVVDAQRNLLNIIAELHVDESMKVSQMLEKDKELQKKLQVFVQGAASVKDEFLPDGSAHVVLQCELNGKGGLAGLFLNPPYQWQYK